MLYRNLVIGTGGQPRHALCCVAQIEALHKIRGFFAYKLAFCGAHLQLYGCINAALKSVLVGLCICPGAYLSEVVGLDDLLQNAVHVSCVITDSLHIQIGQDGREERHDVPTDRA